MNPSRARTWSAVVVAFEILALPVRQGVAQSSFPSTQTAASTNASAPSKDTIPRKTSIGIGHIVDRSLAYTNSDTSKLGVAVAYQIRLRDVNVLTLKAYDNGTDVFCPVQSIEELTGVVVEVSSRDRGLTMNGIRIPDEASAVMDGTKYLSILSFASAAHVTALINRNEAEIVFTNASQLPAAKRAARVSARERWKRTRLELSRESGDAMAPSSFASQWGGFAFDYSAYGHQSAGERLGGFQIAATTAVGGGSLIGYFTGSSSSNRQELRSDVQWRRIWSREAPVTQLNLGQTWATGLTPMLLRGVTATNTPYSRQNTLALLSLDGSVPSDWNVEVHRNGELLGFDSVDASGRYTIPVPIEYGENPFTITAYGPTGETRTFTRVVRTMPEMVSAGRFEYAASAGKCLGWQCQWMFNGDLRYGISSRLTARAGASEYTWHNNIRTGIHPYVGLAAVPVDQIGISVEHMAGALWRTNFSFDPVRAFSLLGNYVRYARSDAGQSLGGIGGREQATVVLRLTPWGYTRSFEVQAFGVRDSLSTSGFVRLSGTFAYRSWIARPYVRLTKTQTLREDFMGLEMTALPTWSRLRHAGPTWFRGALERNTTGDLSLWYVRAIRNVAHNVNAEAGVQWRREIPGTQAVVSLTMNLGAMRANTYATSGNDHRPGDITQNVYGSLRWDGNSRRFIPSPNMQLGRSGIAGVVFIDKNDNGRFDTDDEPVANVRVRVGGTYVTTDARGRYDTWGLAAMDPLGVSVDTTTLGSPWLTPIYNRMIAKATVDRAMTVDIPVVPAGIIDGYVRCGERPCVGVITVMVTHRDSGLQRRLDTFRDGSFYQMGMLPGEYSAVATLSENRGAAAESNPVTFIVTGGATKSNIEITMPPVPR